MSSLFVVVAITKLVHICSENIPVETHYMLKWIVSIQDSKENLIIDW